MDTYPQILAIFQSIGPWEMVVVGIIALLIFGKRLPEVGRSLGRSFVEFKKGLKDTSDELKHTGDELKHTGDELKNSLPADADAPKEKTNQQDRQKDPDKPNKDFNSP